jgi:nucleoside-diphosphate-sugar epimerase
MTSPVLVLGATGQVGLFSIAHLLEGGQEVVAISRHGIDGPATSIPGLARFDLESFRAAVDCDIPPWRDGLSLLSCGPIALAEQVLEIKPSSHFGGWNRAVVVGTTSTRVKEFSPDEDERRKIEGIIEGIARIRRLCAERGTKLSVLSPTLIYGCGKDQNLSRVYRFIRRFGFAPIARRAEGLRQPLHVDDLARTLVRAVTDESICDLDSPVCGGSQLPYSEMIALLFRAAELKTRLLRLPSAAFPAVAAVSRVIPGSGGVSSEMFRRQSRDLVFDDSPARSEAAHDPRAFKPGSADFALPPEIDAIRNALVP